jgi:hypothetical protein
MFQVGKNVKIRYPEGFGDTSKGAVNIKFNKKVVPIKSIRYQRIPQHDFMNWG